MTLSIKTSLSLFSVSVSPPALLSCSLTFSFPLPFSSTLYLSMIPLPPPCSTFTQILSISHSQGEPYMSLLWLSLLSSFSWVLACRLVSLCCIYNIYLWMRIYWFVQGKYLAEEKNQDKRWCLIHSIQNCICIYTDPLNSMFQFIETFSWIALTMFCHHSVSC